MSILKTEDFDFTVKTDLKELDASDKLFKYFMVIQYKMSDMKRIINDNNSIYVDWGVGSININDKFTQYKYLNKIVSIRKIQREHNGYLEILKQRLNEVFEYLESLEELKEFI